MRFACFVFLIFTIVSCSKSEQFNSEIIHDKNFVKQSKSCKNVDLYNNPLNHNNSVEIFKCFNWDLKYPKLFNYLINTNDQDWNFLVDPINKAFLNDEIKRDEFLSLVGKLKNNDGFDNLHSFVKVLFSNEKLLNLVIELTDSNNQFRKKYIQALRDKSISIKDMIPGMLAYRDSLKSIREYKSLFNSNFNILEEERFFPKLIPVVDSIANYLMSDDIKKHTGILSDFSINQNNSSIMLNLIGSGFDESDFSDVLFYAADNYLEIEKDFEIFNKSLEVELLCPGSNNSYEFKLNSKYEVFKKVDALLSIDENIFWQELVDSKAKLTTFRNFCNPEIANEDLLKVLTRIHNQSERFFQNPINFSLMAELHKLLYRENDEESKLNFIKLLDSEFTKSLLDLSNFVSKKDRSFYLNIFRAIKSFDLNFYVNLDKFIETAVREKNSGNLSLIGEVWNSLSVDQKYELLVLLKYNTDDRFDFYQIIKYYTDFIMLNDNLGEIFYETIFVDAESSEKALNILNREVKKMKNDYLLDELASFLSKDSLIRLFEFFSSGYKGVSADNDDSIDIGDINVVNYDFINNEVRECLYNVTQQFTNDFYTSVFQMPDLCKDHFSGKMVFDAMISLQKADEDFKQRSGLNLIGKDLLLNSQMMKDIFSAIVGLNYYGLKNEVIDSDLSEIVEPINKFLYKDNNSLFLDEIIILIDKVNKFNPRKFQDNLLEILEIIVTDKELSKTTLGAIAKASSVEFRNTKRAKCSDLVSDFNDLKCASKNELKSYIKNIYNMIFEKNDSQFQFLEEAVNLFRKDIGIRIPVRAKKNAKNFSLSLKRFGEMLSTLSESGKKNVLYKTDINEYVTNTSILSRVEVVIKDIGFLDNFYGAFFMNKVAESKNYVKEIKKLKKNVKLLNKTGGILRSTKIFPESTKYQLDNILETYDSLWEAGEIGFSDELQAALALVSITSPIENSDFQPYRIPKVEKVKGHKGQILTRMSEIRALSHVAELYKESYWKNGKFVSDEKLNTISDNFLMIFSEQKLKESLRQLDFQRDKIFILVDSLVELLYRLPDESIIKLKSIVWNFLYLTHKVFDDGEADFMLDNFTSMLELAVQFISNVSIDDDNLGNIIDDVAKFMESLAKMNLDDNDLSSIKKIIDVLFQELDIVNYFNDILVNADLYKNIQNLILQYNKFSNDFENSENIISTLADYISSNQFNEKSLLEFFKNNSEINQSKYLSELISYLAYANGNDVPTNLSKSIKFLFNEDKERMMIFLQEINKSVTFETR